MELDTPLLWSNVGMWGEGAGLRQSTIVTVYSEQTLNADDVINKLIKTKDM